MAVDRAFVQTLLLPPRTQASTGGRAAAVPSLSRSTDSSAARSPDLRRHADLVELARQLQNGFAARSATSISRRPG